MRTKITELGKLHFLDEGGLVCSVTSSELLSLDESILKASLYWASANEGELAVGDLVAHYEHGVARYCGRKSINQGDGEADFLLLEFAHGARLRVPLTRSDLVQKLGMDYALSYINTERSVAHKWPQSYCIEVLPNAYAWPGIGTFPSIPQEKEWFQAPPGSTPQARAERRRAQEMAGQRRAEAVCAWIWREPCSPSTPTRRTVRRLPEASQ